MIKRRSLVAVAASLLLIAGCSDASEEDREVVTVFGPYLGREADLFAASMRTFEQETGIRVDYVGSGDAVPDLLTAVNEGRAPDVALVAQPGLVGALVGLGVVQPLPEPVADRVAEDYVDSLSQLGVIDGTSYGVPYKAAAKSLVWYSPAFFEANGYEVPQSMDELAQLVETIEADGWVPWCFGVQDFAESGWVVTDWIEDLLIRQASEDVYDAWVEGSEPFSGTAVTQAMESFSELVLANGRNPGRSIFLRTSIQDAQDPMFDAEPGCVLHRQASFNVEWLPRGVTIGPDGDTAVFLLPGQSAGEEPPVIVSGELAVAFNDAPATTALMGYLATAESGAHWAAAGGYISPRLTTPTDGYYGNPLDEQLAGSLTNDSVVLRFDGSDIMPPEIGSELLWSTMLEWISGGISIADATARLDQAREAGVA